MAIATSPLFCHQCGKCLDVRNEDMKRVQKHEPESFEYTGSVTGYKGGCFFKKAALLKRYGYAIGEAEST